MQDLDSKVSVSLIMAAMSDVRPGRFYSVDELAATLRVRDRAALHEQLRSMASAPDVDGPFQIFRGASDEFYRRVSLGAFRPIVYGN